MCKLGKVMLLVVGLVMSMGGYAFSKQQSTNLVVDGGFEIGDKIPTKWEMNSDGMNSGGMLTEFVRDTVVKRSGVSSGCIITDERKDNKYTWPSYDFTIENVNVNQFYKAIAYIKTACNEKLPPTTVAYIAFVFLDENNKVISNAQSDFVFGTSDEWEIVRLKSKPPKNTKKIALRLLLYGSGIAWFDDVELICEKDEIDSSQPNINMDVVHIENKASIINDAIEGFGAENDPWLYNEEQKAKGVTEEDIALINERIKNMGISISRVIIWWKIWNPSGDCKTFTLDSDGMVSLYKTLDNLQKLDVDVIVMTGIAWDMKPCPYYKPESAKAIGILLDYLINKKGYTCIKYWQFMNEANMQNVRGRIPENCSFDFYNRMHYLIINEMKKYGLRDKIKIIAPVDSAGLQLFRTVVKRMHDIIDVYSSHYYLGEESVESSIDKTIDRWGIIKKEDPLWKNKKIFIDEFGIGKPKNNTNTSMTTFDNGLQTSEFCIDQLNTGISAFSIWTMYQIYYPGYYFMEYGLWEFKDKDKNWKLRPVFYSYRLFTKFCKRGSKIIKVTNNETHDLIKSVGVENDDGLYIFVLNKAYNDQKICINPSINSGSFSRYLYDEHSIDVKDVSPLIPDKKMDFKENVVNDTIPKRSFAVYYFKK